MSRRPQSVRLDRASTTENQPSAALSIWRRLATPVNTGVLDIYEKSSIDLALKDAFRKMHAFLMKTKGLTEDEAISLISIAVDFSARRRRHVMRTISLSLGWRYGDGFLLRWLRADKIAGERLRPKRKTAMIV